MRVSAASIALAAVASGLHPSAAAAFANPDTFEAGAAAGGGGGRRFTGSARDGFTCSVCHTGGANGRDDLAIDGLPEDVFVPGRSYEILVPRPASAVNVAFALEVVDDRGAAAGRLEIVPDADLADDERCPPAGALPERNAARLYAPEPDRAVVATEACGASRIRARWTAPADGTSAVRLHLTAVSSNGSADSSGDAVTVVARSLPTEGAPPADRSVLDGTCSAGRGRSAWSWLAVVAAVLWRCRRRGRPR